MDKLSVGRYLVVAVFSVFLLICGYSLFSEGMFLDGTLYAAVARNLAVGKGSFWELSFTDTLYSNFHEHPPLVFGLQSIWFYVFGDHLWVERFYSLSTYIVLGMLMTSAWKLITGKIYSAWVSLLFLVLCPLIPWCAANNMLENSMTLFTFSSLVFYLKFEKSHRIGYLFLSGLTLSFAFLSKGFTGLFVWTIPVAMLLVGKSTVKEAAGRTIVMLVSTLLPLVLLFVLLPDSFDSIKSYFDRQVVNSVQNIVTVKSRYYILIKLLTEILIPLGLVVLAIIIGKRHGLIWKEGKHHKLAYSLFIIGFLGVAPIVISLKQSGFYLLCALPFYCLGLALLIEPQIGKLQGAISQSKNALKALKGITMVLLVGALVLGLYANGQLGRNAERVTMVKSFSKVIGEGETVKVAGPLWSDWGLHAYFHRYAFISLSDKESSKFYITKEVIQNKKLLNSSGSYFLYEAYRDK